MESFSAEQEAKQQYQQRKTSGDRSSRVKAPSTALPAPQQQEKSGPTRSERSKGSLADIANGVETSTRSSGGSSKPKAAAPQVTRPAPPVPTAAAPAPRPPLSPIAPASPRSNRGPLPQTPNGGKETDRSSYIFAPGASPAAQAKPSGLPSIHLQEPTPQSVERHRDVHLSSPASSSTQESGGPAVYERG